MKRFLSLILVIVCSFSLMLFSCSDGGTTGNTPPSGGSTITKIDVDLSAMSSTMVYAEVSNITTNPTQYLGKTIKMKGQYTASYYQYTQQYYHYVIIADATACCSKGLEFIPAGSKTYPNDFPEKNTEITVIGTFASYDELGNTYYYIKDATMTY